MDLLLGQHCRFFSLAYIMECRLIYVICLMRVLFSSFHLQAAEETGRKLKVYAVEKNPNAVVTLHVSARLYIGDESLNHVSIILLLN